MIAAIILFLVPVLLFVVAFLYETFLSFKRLNSPKSTKRGYVVATWEITHTLLVVGIINLVMMFTQSITGLASAIFISTFLAAAALIIRSITYCYIFYVRRDHKINGVDWLFALSHVIAAVFLVITVIKALWYIYKNNPPVNSQFLPYFIPGLVVVIAVVTVPMIMLYRTKS